MQPKPSNASIVSSLVAAALVLAAPAQSARFHNEIAPDATGIILTGQAGGHANPFPFHPGPAQPAEPPPTPPPSRPNVAPRPQPQAQNPQGTNYADELTDFGVPPQDELQPDVGTPTPTSIPGGHVVTTTEMRKIVGSDMLLFDVLGGDRHQTLPKTIWLPGLGDGDGSFDDELQSKFATFLAKVTEDDKTKPLIFFCAGAKCWESYNAALRAIHLEYKTVLWYRGGLASWQAAKQPMSYPLNGDDTPSQPDSGN